MRDLPDDPTIADDEPLLRRLLAKWIVPIEGGWRVSSAAFKSSPDNDVSVFRETRSTQAVVLEGYPDHGLAQIRAEHPRRLEHCEGVRVVADEQKDQPPGHALI